MIDLLVKRTIHNQINVLHFIFLSPAVEILYISLISAAIFSAEIFSTRREVIMI